MAPELGNPGLFRSAYLRAHLGMYTHPGILLESGSVLYCTLAPKVFNPAPPALRDNCHDMTPPLIFSFLPMRELLGQ